jgi:hypothetical protein
MPTDEEGREALQSEARQRLEGEDPAREGVERGLASEPARPLTKDEKKAAEHDPGRSARVHAPASERVAKDPAPGDRELIQGE